MITLYRRLRDESRIPQLLFYTGLTVELLIVIVDKSNFINPFEGWLFRITFLLFAMKLLLTKYSLKEWAAIFFLGVIAVISYRVTGKNDLIRAVTFAAACKNIPLKQMLKVAFYVTLAGCMAIMMLSVTGIYGDMSLTDNYGRDVERYDVYSGVQETFETRYTLGMGHPNALACMFLMVMSLGVYVYFDKLKWYGYLFLLFLDAGVFLLTGSKTSILIASVFLVGACLLRYCRFLREKLFLYLCGLLIFVVSVGFSVDAAANAQQVREAQWEEYYLGQSDYDAHIGALKWFDEHITGRIVSLTDTERNDGTIETWTLFSNKNNMSYYFDMGWVKVFYRYGVIPGILSCAACLLLLWQLYRHKDACGLALFAAMAVYTVVEAHLVSPYIGRNYMLMMMGCYLWTFSPKNDMLIQ